MRIWLFVVAILVSSACGADPRTTEDENIGRLCLASVPEPNDDPKSLSNPIGGNPSVTYSVRVADRELVSLRGDHGTWVLALDQSKRHPIVIYADGEQVASFFLNFEDTENSVCLFQNTLYQTWQLWPWKRTGPWCNCEKS